MNDFFSQLPYKCHLEKLASLGHCLQICPQFDCRVAGRAPGCTDAACLVCPIDPTPETRKLKPETRNPKPGTQNREPETRDPKPETRNPDQGEFILARHMNDIELQSSQTV